jgi:hypothetical protein
MEEQYLSSSPAILLCYVENDILVFASPALSEDFKGGQLH